MLKMNLQTFTEEKEVDDVPKTFTQDDVDRIVGERLAREKSKYSDYEDIKAITEELREFGYEGTPQEIRAAIREQKEQIKKQAELEELKKQAEIEGTSPELLKEIKDLKEELANLKKSDQEKKQQEEAKKKQQEESIKQIDEFNEKYPDVDVEKLAQNSKFKKFFEKSNPKLTLLEVYEDFVDLVGGIESETMAKIQSNVARTTTSGKAKQDSEGGGHGLTERQKALAKQAGMSYKDYADLLKDIQ